MEFVSAEFLIFFLITLTSSLKGLSFYEGLLTPTAPLNLTFESVKSSVLGVNLAVMAFSIWFSFNFYFSHITFIQIILLLFTIGSIFCVSWSFYYVTLQQDTLEMCSKYALGNFVFIVLLVAMPET